MALSAFSLLCSLCFLIKGIWRQSFTILHPGIVRPLLTSGNLDNPGEVVCHLGLVGGLVENAGEGGVQSRLTVSRDKGWNSLSALLFSTQVTARLVEYR